MSKPNKIKRKHTLRKITRLEFSTTHYSGIQYPSDMFYVDLANKLYPKIHDVFSEQADFTFEDSKRAAITLACYVEDLVAGNGVWAAFISLYKKKYEKHFPFYDIENDASLYPYDDEMPSFHAVLFLLWYVANEANPESILNPNNPALRQLALEFIPDLIDAYEDAPDTPPARPMFMTEEEIGVPLFYQVRNVCSWLCERCYLTHINNGEAILDEFVDFIYQITQSHGEDESIVEYAVNSFVPMNALIGPLAIPAYEWLAEIVDLYHEPEEEVFLPILSTIKSRPYAYYRYVTVGEKELVLEDFSGERYSLSSFTMPGEKFPAEIIPGNSTLLSLVYFDGVWLMNGIASLSLPAKLYNKYKQAYNEKGEQRRLAYESIIKNLGGQRLGVCGSYNEYMKLAFGNDELPGGGDPKLIDEVRAASNLLYFLNADGSMSILPEFAPCVKIKDNPYYDESKALRQGLALILDHSISTSEMRDYIIKNKLIPDAALNSAVSVEVGRKLFQENIHFLNDYSDRDTMPFVVEM